MKKNIKTVHVKFDTYASGVLNKITRVNLCYNNNEMYCDKTERLVIPEKNLVTGESNENVYFRKIANEIMRYSNLREFILEQKSRMYLPDEKLKLLDNEILLFDSEINSNFFKGLVAKHKSDYIVNKMKDTVNAERSVFYSNKIKLTGLDELKKSCFSIKTLGNNKLAPQFPPKTHEKTYKNSKACIIQLIVDIAAVNKVVKQPDVILNDLLNEYISLYSTYSQKFINMLKVQDKSNFAKKLKNVKSDEDVKELIMSPEFNLTNIDLWILVNLYKIPCILLNNTPKGLKENNEILLPLYVDEDKSDNYVFILVSKEKDNISPTYHVIVRPSDQNPSMYFETFNINVLPGGDSKSILEVFKRLETSHYVKKDKLKIRKPDMLTIEKYIEYM